MQKRNYISGLAVVLLVLVSWVCQGQAPVVSSLDPLNNAVDIYYDATTLTITFNKNVKVSPSSGTTDETSVRIFKNPGNILVRAFDRASSLITIGGAKVTIGLPERWDSYADYYVLIGNKVFSDMTGNNFTGFSTEAEWTFRTQLNGARYYSRQSGLYSDVSTWTHYYNQQPGPIASDAQNGGGTDATIRAGHTVTMNENINTIGGPYGLKIEPGAVLNANSFGISVEGKLDVQGTLLNADFIDNGFYPLAILNTSGNPLIVGRLANSRGDMTLGTDLVVLNGIDDMTRLNLNGFRICDGSVDSPILVDTATKSTAITFTWTKSIDDAFIVARKGSSSFKPEFGKLYNANTTFGSGDAIGAGNYAVYSGSGTTVDITGLTPSTDYEFDIYNYNTAVGGCYNRGNHRFVSITTCPPLAAPINPINASYCAGDTKPAIKVNSPGGGMIVNWYDAAVGGNLVAGDRTGGDGSGSTFIPAAASGTFYAEIYDGTTCSSDVRSAVTLTQNPVLVLATATGTQSICAGGDPSVLSGGTPTGGDGSYTYQWESVPANTKGPYVPITGAKSITYDPSAGIEQTTNYHLVVTSGSCASKTSNVVTITISNIPANVTALAAVAGDAQASLSWSNPTTCFEEVMIVAKQGAAPATVPSGNGALYTANAVFGSGTAIAPNEYVVYKGNKTSAVVTGLTNSIAYTFKVYTHNGTFWSTGATTSSTGIPTPPILTFSPVNGATNVSVNGNLAISFDEPVRAINDAALTNSSAAGLVSLRVTNSSGATVPFAASINSAKTSITLDPTATLLPNQLYYLSIAPVEDSNNNATATSSITFTTEAAPTISLVTPISVCVGQPITINGSNFGAAVPTVLIGTTSMPVKTNSSTTITIVPDAAASGVVKVTNISTSLSAVSSSAVTVNPLPVVAIQTPPSNEQIIDNSLAFSATADQPISVYVWNFGDGNESKEENPEHTYTSEGGFPLTLNVTSDKNCPGSATSSVSILPFPFLANTAIKNVVTANGDEKNDKLTINNIDRFPDNSISVIDRWGVEVFSQKGYNNEWDFKKGSDYLPVGNYICIVKLNNEGKVITRTVTLMR